MNRPLVLGTAALAVVVCGLAWSGAAGPHTGPTGIKASPPARTQPSAPVTIEPAGGQGSSIPIAHCFVIVVGEPTTC